MYRGSFHGNLVFGKSSGKAPVCADCHEAHNIMPPESQEFRAQIDTLCANCHEEELQTYLDSYHGKAFYLGDLKTAVCTDCHGGHRILAPSDPDSSVNEANLIGPANATPAPTTTSSSSWSTSTRRAPALRSSSGPSTRRTSC